MYWRYGKSNGTFLYWDSDANVTGKKKLFDLWVFLHFEM